MKETKRWLTIGLAIIALLSFGFMYVPQAHAYSGKILFDQGHGETAGNADWTITGGYSEFANALRSDGYSVYSTTSTLTSSLLSGYDVLILPEPNTNFTSSEKAAINSFVANGGGVYFISDHANSDRNNDGWDSVEIFNGYLSGSYNSSTDWVGKTFGFTFDTKTVSQDPITDIRYSSVTDGVYEVGCWSGTTIQVTGSNSSIVKDIFLSSQSNPYHIHGSYGYGRFAALGDSSPYDDGTGAPGDSLHPNWYDYDHSTLAVNTVGWLAGDR